MHQTASTSREAYRHLDASSQYESILRYMRSISPESICIADLAHSLHMERSTVSARLNELKRMDAIEYHEKRKSVRTGITAMHWRVKLSETLF